MSTKDDLTLDQNGQTLLAFSYLRIIDLDIAASSKKERTVKLKDRESLIKQLGDLVPPEIRGYSSSLSGSLSTKLRELSSQVSNPTHRAMILSELTLIDPWTGRTAVFKHKIDPHVRRIGLKDVAAVLNWPNSDDVIDKALDEVLPRAKSETVDFGKIFKVSAAVAGGFIIGGLVLAPHIGAAIGAGMGLSGAAATSAGLAALGFGSLASGGFGMAGGMMMVGAVSGLLGGGVTTIASISETTKTDSAVEAQKLHITLYFMKSRGETQGRASGIISDLEKYIQELDTQISQEKAKSTPDKDVVRRLSKERRLASASIPKTC